MAHFKQLMECEHVQVGTARQCDQKKSPNVYKSCLKTIRTGKMIDFDTFTKIA